MLKSWMGVLRPQFACVFLSLLSSACVPHFLEKYRQQSPNHELRPSAQGRRNAPASVVMIDPGTVRFQAAYDKVWDGMLDVLLKNYNLAIADRANGLVTTEWDSYYLDDRVHRNKLSIRLKKINPMGTELQIYNNVEVLSRSADGVTELWLPTNRNKPEIGRVIQNMAIALNLSAPDLPVEMLAAAPAQPNAPKTESF